jgi:hypothetical protein
MTSGAGCGTPRTRASDDSSAVSTRLRVHQQPARQEGLGHPHLPAARRQYPCWSPWSRRGRLAGPAPWNGRGRAATARASPTWCWPGRRHPHHRDPGAHPGAAGGRPTGGAAWLAACGGPFPALSVLSAWLACSSGARRSSQPCHLHRIGAPAEPCHRKPTPALWDRTGYREGKPTHALLARLGRSGIGQPRRIGTNPD